MTVPLTSTRQASTLRSLPHPNLPLIRFRQLVVAPHLSPSTSTVAAITRSKLSLLTRHRLRHYHGRLLPLPVLPIFGSYLSVWVPRPVTVLQLLPPGSRLERMPLRPTLLPKHGTRNCPLPALPVRPRPLSPTRSSGSWLLSLSAYRYYPPLPDTHPGMTPRNCPWPMVRPWPPGLT